MEKLLEILKYGVFAILLTLHCMVAHSEEVFVEAEGFKDKGGWCLNQQYMDQMGSPYLMAHGLGRPVKDARTVVTFAEAGEYHVYVRTYNWTAPWFKQNGPGKFQLLIGGRKLQTVFGADGDKWHWQYGGNVKVGKNKRQVEVRLHDLTGFNGRIDAIYFTTEGQVAPPDAGELLKRFRNRLHPLPVREVGRKYDLVIVGGGVAGLCAAGSASRLGCKVALIHDRHILGGNNSSEIRVHLGGKIEQQPYPHLGGLIKEFGPSKGGNAMPADFYEDSKKQDWFNQLENVDLFDGYHVDSVETAAGRIVSVMATSIYSADRIRIAGSFFADCSGDGTVGYLAGADWRMGREARSEYQEASAPVVPDSMVMGASVQWYAENENSPSKFPLFNYGITFTEQNCQKVSHGEWNWETGIGKDQIKEAEVIRDYGMLVIFSNWSFLKNNLKDNKKFQSQRLEWVSYLGGKRESRRLLGDYVLSENDIKLAMPHEDASFITSWSIDLHSPNPNNQAAFPTGAFKSIAKQAPIKAYAVPYRCLYSRNIQNLFMAGRDISVTHVALGSVRVMRTTGMMGEVVGMAASLCKKLDTTPRGVYLYYLDDLKQLMTNGVGGIGFHNNQKYNVTE